MKNCMQLRYDTSFSVLYRQFDIRDECDSATRQIVGHELAYNAQVWSKCTKCVFQELEINSEKHNGQQY